MELLIKLKQDQRVKAEEEAELNKVEHDTANIQVSERSSESSGGFGYVIL